MPGAPNKEPTPNGPSSSRERSSDGQPPKRRIGRFELRLTLAAMAMSALPLVFGILLAARLGQQAALFYNPRVRQELERALETYRPLVRAIKSDMAHRADAIAAREPLRAAAIIEDAAEMNAELTAAFARYSDRPDADTGENPLVSLAALSIYRDLSFEDCLAKAGPSPSAASSARAASASASASPSASPDGSLGGRQLATISRPTPIDPARDAVLRQCRPLGGDEAIAGAPMLVATFTTERSRFEHLRDADEFVRVYKEIEGRRDEWARLNLVFFALIFFSTIVGGAAFGFMIARTVSRRVGRIADAAGRVARGDLAVRVPEGAPDEIGGLERVFNRMLNETAGSRARIEYLQRIGAWQDMARRLAHEIKNPLTPIQLAVEECHSKFKPSPDDPADERFAKLLDTTLEIVREEVGTLRRLVSEFSSFARLPRAKLEEAELSTLLAEQKPVLERLGIATDESEMPNLTPSGGFAIPVRVIVDPVIAKEPDGKAEPGEALVAVDRQMLRKSIDNLVRNAVQAIRATGKGYRVRVHGTVLQGGRIALDVDDDGPGVPEDARDRVFDPYFTTRTEGTGLGLAIVKKIVIEHGGTISCDRAPDGGARFRILLPSMSSPEGRAALEEAAEVLPMEQDGVAREESEP